MAHVDHGSVDAVFLLVMGDDALYGVPEAGVAGFGVVEFCVVHAYGVVRDVVERGVVVQFQVGDVCPWGLAVVWRPVGECACDGACVALAGEAGVAAVRVLFDAFRGGSEPVAIACRWFGQVLVVVFVDLFVDTVEGIVVEFRRCEGCCVGRCRRGVVEPVEPVGMFWDPVVVDGGCAEDVFEHDAQSEVVGCFYKCLEGGFCREAEGWFGKQGVYGEVVLNGVGGAKVAFAVDASGGGERQEVDGVCPELFDVGQEGYRFEQCAGFTESSLQWIGVDGAVSVVIEGCGEARKEVVDCCASAPGICIGSCVLQGVGIACDDCFYGVAVVALGVDADDAGAFSEPEGREVVVFVGVFLRQCGECVEELLEMSGHGAMVLVWWKIRNCWKMLVLWLTEVDFFVTIV